MWIRAGLFLLGVQFCAAVSMAKTVTLGEADNHTEIALVLGDTLVVQLPSTLPGQYTWRSRLGNHLGNHVGDRVGSRAPLIALNEVLLPVQGNGAEKGAGTQQFRYNAAMVGETVLRLEFEPERGAAGAASNSTFSVKVQVASGAPGADEAILTGVYKGRLPCADCAGLDTEIRLYAKGRFDTTDAFYVRTQTYRDTPRGDVTFSDRGVWAVLKGDAVDPNATVYQLNPDDVTERQSFLLTDKGDALVQLDRELKPIATKMNLTLRKVQ